MKNLKIGVIGLGYVGLPLAVAFAKKYSVVGYDISTKRVNEVNNNKDITLEIDDNELQEVNINNFDKSRIGLFSSNRLSDLKNCNFYIITVPTPVDKNHKPILKPLIKASQSVGKILSKGDYVVYESTVYPGATEEDCLPVLEKQSGLKLNKDFYLGYSPERINPGDKEHTLTKIKKVTSGSSIMSSKFIDKVYNSIITAGTHLAPTIKVAEAAKVIENTQRDINIAFVNELAKIFNLINVNTHDVLDAARTKWNFLPFSPGLVGGHCIGVDPYYLAQKAQEVGYIPEMILSGRRINESMGSYVADQVIKALIGANLIVSKVKVLIMGITFKENCPDIRNTGVVNVINRFNEFGINTVVFDPWADPDEVKEEYGISSQQNPPKEKYDAIVLTVAHSKFKKLDINKLKKDKTVIYDVKNFLDDYTHKL